MTPNRAYMDATFALESNHKGPLSGKTFAVKDVFDIATSDFQVSLPVQQYQKHL